MMQQFTRSIKRQYSASSKRYTGVNDGVVSSVLESLLNGSISKEVAAKTVETHFRKPSKETLDVGEFARIDVNRAARAGFPEGKVAHY
jgi:hypothetical protein